MLGGDLHAEIAAAKTGLAAMIRLLERYGVETFDEATERMFDHGEQVIRRFFEDIPDGRYVGRGAMDTNGVENDLVPLEIALEVSGSDVIRRLHRVGSRTGRAGQLPACVDGLRGADGGSWRSRAAGST